MHVSGLYPCVQALDLTVEAAEEKMARNIIVAFEDVAIALSRKANATAYKGLWPEVRRPAACWNIGLRVGFSTNDRICCGRSLRAALVTPPTCAARPTAFISTCCKGFHTICLTCAYPPPQPQVSMMNHSCAPNALKYAVGDRVGG